jgi:hypothetical protein
MQRVVKEGDELAMDDGSAVVKPAAFLVHIDCAGWNVVVAEPRIPVFRHVF